MRAFAWLLALGLSMWVGACAESSDDNGPTVISISGTAYPHPLDVVFAGEAEVDFTSLGITIINPLAALGGGAVEPLAEAELAAVAGCAGDACAYELPEVNITGASMGLVIGIDDLPVAPDRWLAVGNPVAPQPLTERVDNPSPLTGLKSYAFGVTAEAALAEDLGKAPGALVEKGFVVGRVVDAEGNPIAGATVTCPSSALDLYLLDEAYANDNAATTTASHGIFLAASNQDAKAPVLTQLNVSASASGSTWSPETIGFAGGVALIVDLKAQAR